MVRRETVFSFGIELQERDVVLLADLYHIIRPDACLDFTDMRLVQQHAQP